MELQTIARRYACALFLLDKHFEIKEYLGALASLWKNSMCVELIHNAVVPPQEKAKIISELFGDHVPEYIKNFIKLLCEKRRFNCIKLINREFNKMLSNIEKIHYLKLETANLDILPDHQTLQQELEQRLHAKIQLKIKKNIGLIAGTKITLDEYVIDGSFKKLYESLHASLLA